MDMTNSGYGLWTLVIINSAIFLMFSFSFARPRSGREWRSFGAFSAFLIALFTEMYGFPLTIYLISGWLQRRSPGTDVYSHNAGHLWESVFGWDGDPHLNPLHLMSYVVIFAGFALLAKAWPVLYRAQRAAQLAMTGPYGVIRHPQYVGFVLIMFGFLIQWPTIVTLGMFPILVTMYLRLSRREEREATAEFGPAYVAYAAATPAFFPSLRSKAQSRSVPAWPLSRRHRSKRSAPSR